MSLIQNILEVAQQVAVLFLLMAVGVVLAKTKKLTDAGIREMTHLLLTIVTVCVIVESFLTVEFSKERLGEMLISAACSVFSVAAGALLTKPLFRKVPGERQVLRFGTCFSNCGYMALPLVSALFGNEGVFLVSIYLAVFQVCLWTYGVTLFPSPDGKGRSFKKALLNPGVIGILIGLPLFLLHLSVPQMVLSPVAFLADLNTPLAMIITGFYLAASKLKLFAKDIRIIWASLLRLLVVPLLLLALLKVCRVSSALLPILMVPACTPSASVTTLFAVEFGGDEETASRMITISTLLSILTMPLVIALAQTIA